MFSGNLSSIITLLSMRDLGEGWPLPLNIHAALPLAKQNLCEVEGHEADSHSNGPFHPVHAEPLVQATDESLFPDDLSHSVDDGPV